MISGTEVEYHGLSIDFGDTTIDQLIKINIPKDVNFIVYLPLPSIGKTNSYRDIAEDLRDASYVAELLAKYSGKAKAEYDYPNNYDTRVKLTLISVEDKVKEILIDCYLAILGCTGFPEFQDRFDELCEKIYVYEDELDEYAPLVPEIVDWYFANLVGGVYYELQHDAPEFYSDQLKNYPERQLGFCKSAYSNRVGAECYASSNGWLIPAATDFRHFLKVTEQKYLAGDFVAGEVFTVEGASFVRTENQLLYFPMNHYFRSKVCASLIIDNVEEVMDRFDWQDATFTHSPYREYLRAMVSSELRSHDPVREKCMVHEEAGIISLNDGVNLHVLFDTKALSLHKTKGILDHVNTLANKLVSYIGLSDTLLCSWDAIDDERFEELCYDVIFSHPKFNSETIKKMGKSRSRDGGRDIVVFDIPSSFQEKPKKWVFQCKLISNGSSLSATKLVDVGDMLDQYEAEGFGVMTSSFIDATLYDKLEKVCGKRAVDEKHFSVFELERFLSRHESIKNKYFGN